MQVLRANGTTEEIETDSPENTLDNLHSVLGSEINSLALHDGSLIWFSTEAQGINEKATTLYKESFELMQDERMRTYNPHSRYPLQRHTTDHVIHGDAVVTPKEQG